MAAWRPDPPERMVSTWERSAYRAGYSDGWHGYPPDPGDWGPGFRGCYHEGHRAGSAAAAEPDRAEAGGGSGAL